MQAIGTKDELEAFADYSELFDKAQNVTTSEIDRMFEEEFLINHNLLIIYKSLGGICYIK